MIVFVLATCIWIGKSQLEEHSNPNQRNDQQQVQRQREVGGNHTSSWDRPASTGKLASGIDSVGCPNGQKYSNTLNKCVEIADRTDIFG